MNTIGGAEEIGSPNPLKRELNEGAESYRLVFELMSDFGYSADMLEDGTAIYRWTIGNYERMTGYPCEEHLNSSASAMSFVYPEDWPKFQRHFQKLRAGQSDIQEYRVIKKGGEIRWLRHYGKPVWSDELNRIVNLQGAIQDITERKSAEEELERHRNHLEAMVKQRTGQLTYSNTLLQQEILVRRCAEQKAEELRQENELILNSVGQGIFGLDLSGRFTFVNPVAAQMLGYSVDELMQQEVGLIAGPELRERLARLVDAPASERGKPNEVIEDQSFKRQDGSVFPVGYVQSVIAKGDQVVGYLIGFVDVTERNLYHEQFQRQSYRLQTLHAIDRAIQASESPEAIASATLTQLRVLVPYARANIVLYDLVAGTYEPLASFHSGTLHPVEPKGNLNSVRALIMRQRQGQVYACNCQQTDSSVCTEFNFLCHYPGCSAIFVPLIYQGELIGSLNLVKQGRQLFSDDHMDILKEVADSLVIAIQNARLFRQVRDGRERLRALAEYLQSARESERQTIAREIHDEFGQALSVLKMDLGWIDRRLSKNAVVLHQRVEQMNSMIGNLIDMLHKISTELRPVMLDDLGLPAAIEWQVQEFSSRTGITCDLSVDSHDLVPEPHSALLVFRILQEALTNVGRHARATKVEIRLKMSPALLSLMIRDNGIGIDERSLNDPLSLGLLGMRERAVFSGGKVTISGAPGAGTTVVVEIPQDLAGSEYACHD